MTEEIPIYQTQKDGQVFFGVTVSKRRAEYLYQCLHRPLCGYCNRELDECEADPCQDRRIEAGELAHCAGCYELLDPAALHDGLCSECHNLEVEDERKTIGPLDI